MPHSVDGGPDGLAIEIHAQSERFHDDDACLEWLRSKYKTYHADDGHPTRRFREDFEKDVRACSALRWDRFAFPSHPHRPLRTNFSNEAPFREINTTTTVGFHENTEDHPERQANQNSTRMSLNITLSDRNAASRTGNGALNAFKEEEEGGEEKWKAEWSRHVFAEAARRRTLESRAMVSTSVPSLDASSNEKEPPHPNPNHQDHHPDKNHPPEGRRESVWPFFGGYLTAPTLADQIRFLIFPHGEDRVASAKGRSFFLRGSLDFRREEGGGGLHGSANFAPRRLPVIEVEPFWNAQRVARRYVRMHPAHTHLGNPNPTNNHLTSGIPRNHDSTNGNPTSSISPNNPTQRHPTNNNSLNNNITNGNLSPHSINPDHITSHRITPHNCTQGVEKIQRWSFRADGLRVGWHLRDPRRVVEGEVFRLLGGGGSILSAATSLRYDSAAQPFRTGKEKETDEERGKGGGYRLRGVVGSGVEFSPGDRAVSLFGRFTGEGWVGWRLSSRTTLELRGISAAVMPFSSPFSSSTGLSSPTRAFREEKGENLRSIALAPHAHFWATQAPSLDLSLLRGFSYDYGELREVRRWFGLLTCELTRRVSLTRGKQIKMNETNGKSDTTTTTPSQARGVDMKLFANACVADSLFCPPRASVGVSFVSRSPRVTVDAFNRVLPRTFECSLNWLVEFREGGGRMRSGMERGGATFIRVSPVERFHHMRCGLTWQF
ncbi:unnamed protein product [Phytomonas sp. EM1]|nr:unnamed protein product [Phytomonas sp. EM1]|eukprot:CCW65201.1 unnamed protein product [Phytomonas sp. isolate EM1]